MLSTKKSHSEVADRILLLRKSLGLTQKELSRSVGLAPNTISDMETGKTSVTEIFLVVLELRYAINARWVKTGEGEMFQAGHHQPVGLGSGKLYVPVNEREERKKLYAILCAQAKKVRHIYDLVTLCHLAYRASMAEPEASLRISEEIRNLMME